MGESEVRMVSGVNDEPNETEQTTHPCIIPSHPHTTGWPGRRREEGGGRKQRAGISLPHLWLLPLPTLYSEMDLI